MRDVIMGERVYAFLLICAAIIFAGFLFRLGWDIAGSIQW